MPQIADLVIPVVTGTPGYTFEPKQANPANSVWKSTDAVISASAQTLIMGFDSAKSNRATDKITMRYDYPLVRTVDTISSVSDTARIKVDVILPETMTAAEKLEFWTNFEQLVSLPMISGYAETLSPAY